MLSLLRRLRRLMIADSESAFDSEWQRARDDSHNALTTPSYGHLFMYEGLYLVEAYPPSLIGNLLDGIARLGWNKGDSSWQPRDLLTSVTQGRARGGFRYRVGPIVRKPGIFLKSIVDRLPHGVEYVDAAIVGLTPTTTFAVFHFVFDETVAGQLDQLLRERYATRGERHGAWTSIIDVRIQKRAAIDSYRRQLRRSCSDWVKSRLPGAFADGARELAACELITEAVWPFYEEQVGYPTVHGMLPWQTDWNAWDQRGSQCFRVFEPDRGDLDILSVAAGRAAMRSNAGAGSFGADRHGYTSFFRNQLDDTVVLWGLRCLLKYYGEGLASLRDARVLREERRLVGVFAALRWANRQIAATSVDAERVTEDVDQLDRIFAPEWSDILDASPVRPDVWGEVDLRASWIGQCQQQAKRIARQAKSLRESLALDASLYATVVNLRLQVLVLVLTGIALVVSFLALYRQGSDDARKTGGGDSEVSPRQTAPPP